MNPIITLRSPLFTTWSDQYVRLNIQGLRVGDARALRIDGAAADFQYTGRDSADGAEVFVRIGFAPNQTRTLEFVPAGKSSTDLARVEVSTDAAATIGVKGREVHLSADPSGLFDAVGPFPLQSKIRVGGSLSRTVARLGDGPLFIDYEIQYRVDGVPRYTVQLRCYRHEPYIEVAETFGMGMGAKVEIVLNPQTQFDKIMSHVPVDFEGETQPAIQDLRQNRPNDLVCRLQMPRMGEYFVPTSRSWFSFFDSRNEGRGMLGILALHGGKWTNPVVNMMRVLGRDGKTEMHSSLDSGSRYWLLYAGPVEKEFTLTRPFVFDRLNGEFNYLRLDEHLDLSGDVAYDTRCWDQPAFYGPRFRERAKANAAALPPLRENAEKGTDISIRALLDPTPAAHQALVDRMIARLDKWVRQFQGHRDGEGDYNKSVIGFSRVLRTLMTDYEMLRKDAFLTDEQIRKINAYFAFTARRILDPARWPHERSWLHPDHPESTRDIYTYNGEHKPDRLIWTNCLPNFQSDPMCALLHMSALLPEHPDSAKWRNFALDDLERQLVGYASASGAWEESINYVLYTMSYFVITFRVLKNRLGIDYFNDARLHSVAAWLVRFFGPFDKRFDAYTFPGIGNARVPQQYCECLLAYAGELAESDPLRADLISVYQKMEPVLTPNEHRPLLLAVAELPSRQYPLRPQVSEHMIDLGVSMRHAHPSPKESYLFQKIGFFKDHYEADETALNWYAKGTPLAMEYGTYTGDAGAAAAHNLVEIPDTDGLRRGYLADKFFTPLVDYSRSEVPVTLKLSWGHLRTFAEIDGPPVKPMFFYLGEDNPIGPKTWKTRILMFVKPDYIVLFDRVFGAVPHRYNMHVTANDITRKGSIVRAKGRFDLDLLCFVQTPTSFRCDIGEFAPAPQIFGSGETNPHRQKFFRVYNETGDAYRTALFAQERGRDVKIQSIGACGMHVVTPEYEDYVFINDTVTDEKIGDVAFRGRSGWIRREKNGRVMACIPDGDLIAAFGTRLEGRGPFSYNMDSEGGVRMEGPPRAVRVG